MFVSIYGMLQYAVLDTVIHIWVVVVLLLYLEVSILVISHTVDTCNIVIY